MRRRKPIPTVPPPAPTPVTQPAPLSVPHVPLSTRTAPQLRELTVRTLQVRAGTINEEERSIEAVLSTENPVQVLDMRTWQVIDEILLGRGAEFEPQIVLLDNHMRWSNDDVLGSIRGIRIEANGQTAGRLHFAAGDERAEKIWNKVRQGHITDVSVGYRALESVDIPPNTSQRVAGREFRAGARTLRVTTRWRMREGSVTPIGADQVAKMRADGLLSPQLKGSSMSQALRAYLESIGLRSDASDSDAWTFYNRLQGAQRERGAAILEGRIIPAGTERTDPPANPPAPPAAPPAGQRSDPPATPPAAPPAQPAPSPAPAQRASTEEERIRREAADAERARIDGIRGLATAETRPEWVEHCIRGNLTIYQAGLYILQQERALRAPAVDGAPAGHARGHERDCTVRSLTAGFLLRMGFDPFAQFRALQQQHRAPNSPAVEQLRTQLQGVSEAELHRACDLGMRYADMSLLDLCREACRISGARDPETGTEPYTREGFIRAAVSTPTLSNVFTTSVNARMMQAFMEVEDTSDWCGTEDVADFKTNERLALGKQAGLEKLPRGTTAKHATFSDAKEEYKLARYAKQFVIDEQDIIDDNLSAFQTVPSEMGQAAARLRPDLVYSILLANAALADSVALFHATHANTATNAFSKANLQAAISAMGKQTDGGIRIAVRPKFLLVPGDLEFDARELLTSASLIIAGVTDAVRGSRNVITDLALQLRVEGRLDASGVTDPNTGTAYTGSATTWFLAGQSGRTIVVGYRSGTGRRPMVRRFVLDRGQWGIGWDINMDIGAKALAYQNLYRGNT
ncbi:MAG: Mu-like prophage major head subunit gpT family protein [Phycisphaerales bacterium]|nr:Mu-like prophage major head subunit gpT family protein [Phycisphaerales bacterium]